MEAKTKALPLPATNIKVSNNIPKKIYITWSASQSPDVVQYRIYRSSYKSLGYSNIAAVNSNTLEYTDEVNADKKEYYYKVIAVDKDNLESSSDIEAIKGISLAPPAKPILTLAQIQGNKAILNWQAGDNRAISYNVHKRVKKNWFLSDTVNFKNVTSLRFEDHDILKGVDYYYSVQAVDEFGILSSKSDEAKLALPETSI